MVDPLAPLCTSSGAQSQSDTDDHSRCVRHPHNREECQPAEGDKVATRTSIARNSGKPTVWGHLDRWERLLIEARCRRSHRLAKPHMTRIGVESWMPGHQEVKRVKFRRRLH